jgi:hypothetical protein
MHESALLPPQRLESNSSLDRGFFLDPEGASLAKAPSMRRAYTVDDILAPTVGVVDTATAARVSARDSSSVQPRPRPALVARTGVTSGGPSSAISAGAAGQSGANAPGKRNPNSPMSPTSEGRIACHCARMAPRCHSCGAHT